MNRYTTLLVGALVGIISIASNNNVEAQSTAKKAAPKFKLQLEMTPKPAMKAAQFPNVPDVLWVEENPKTTKTVDQKAVDQIQKIRTEVPGLQGLHYLTGGAGAKSN